ncbi:MAG: cell division protein ZapA [Gammaproteobacteria bacterium]|nr:MAG: cell division protein ZapA [Gammaproteobacteria bacterium]
MSKTEPLTITIMGKEYRIACPDEEKDNLRASADLLNDKLTEIKQQGSVIGTERIAIMVALNLSHEVLHSASINTEHDTLNQRIDALSERIDDSMRNIQLL